MSFARAVFWNTIIQTIGRGVSTALGLVFLAVMTRALGPDGFGGFSIVIAFLQFFGIIVDFGLTLTANRMLGEAKEKQDDEHLMSNLMTMRFLSALVFLGLAPIITASFFPYSVAIKQGIIIGALSFLAIIMTQTLVPVLQKNLRMGRVVVAELVGRLVLLVGVGLAAWFKLGMLWFVAVVVVGSLVNYFCLKLLARPFVRLGWSFDFNLWRKIIVTSWPIGISIIFNLVYLKADMIILSVLRPAAEIGFYGAAYRVLDILTGLATMFMGLVLPAMTAAWIATDREKFRRLFQGSFDVMTFVALPVILFGVLLGRPLMILVAGSDFAMAGDILAILIIAMGAVFFSTLFGHIVVVLNKQKPMIWGYAITAVLSLAAYAILIPRFGIWGAAWGTVFSEALIVVITSVVVVKTSRMAPSLRNFGKTLLSIFVAGVIVLFSRDASWILAGIFGIISYITLLCLTQAVTKETVKEILKLKT